MRHIYALITFVLLGFQFIYLTDILRTVGEIQAKTPKEKPVYLLEEIKPSKKTCKSIQWCFVDSNGYKCSAVDPKLPDGQFFKICEVK